jgi:hypothetical protein
MYDEDEEVTNFKMGPEPDEDEPLELPEIPDEEEVPDLEDPDDRYH